MRRSLSTSLYTAINWQLFLVVWGLAAVVSVLMFINVITDQRTVYAAIPSICYPILIIKVVLDLEIWHNRQVVSAAITRGRSRLEIVFKPFFYLLLSHIIFYAVISLLFLPGGIGKLAILQYALPQAGLTAWIICLSFVTEKRIVAAAVVLIYLYFVAPFIAILGSPPEIDVFDVVRSWPAFVQFMIAKITYVLPPVWHVGGTVGRDSLMSAELLAKCFASTLLPMVTAYRLFKAKDI